MGPRGDPGEPGKFLLVGGTQLRMHRRKSRLLAREFLVKVGRIGCALDRREVRRRDPLVVDIVKVDILEEQVALDVFSISLAGSQSSRRVSRK